MTFLSLKKSPTSSIHQNFHQNWWQKKLKIGRNYCHQNWWHFRHSRTHQFLQFTKIFTKIGEKLGENSVENSIHQNVHQNWWQFWQKCTRKWVPYPTSFFVWKYWYRQSNFCDIDIYISRNNYDGAYPIPIAQISLLDLFPDFGLNATTFDCGGWWSMTTL